MRANGPWRTTSWHETQHGIWILIAMIWMILMILRHYSLMHGLTWNRSQRKKMSWTMCFGNDIAVMEIGFDCTYPENSV